MQLCFRDNERRCEADDVAVGRLREQARFGHSYAEIPGGFARFAIVDDDGVEEAFAAYFDEQVGVSFYQLLYAGAEDFAEGAGVLG